MNGEAKIRSPADLTAWRRALPPGRAVTVLTGTFDILQPGNLRALACAAERGGEVCVVLEPDDVAAGHTTAGRPQHDVATRAEFLSHLRPVTAITTIRPEAAEVFFRGLAPYAWVVGRPQRATDPLAKPAAAQAETTAEVEPVAGCFTEEIHDAIRRDATPMRVVRSGFDAVQPAQSERQGVVVTVNGCFDILHIGHLRFLAQARAMGDRLVVLLNDDASVARYKGPTRPVFPLVFRMAALRAAESVDEVQVFGEDTPLDLLARVRPDIHVKGGSYEPERVRTERELVERWGGRLAFCPLAEGYSTSEYIRKALRAGGVPL